MYAEQIETINYLVGQQDAINHLDAQKRKRRLKLKCKVGYEQRGAVCQRKNPKKLTAKSGIVTTALAAAGAAAIGAKVLEKTKNQKLTPAIPTTSSPSSKTENKKKAVVAASATAAVIGIAVTADNKYEIKDKLIAQAANTAYTKVTSLEDIDKKIDNLPLSDSQKQKAKKLTGFSKVYIADLVLSKQKGFEKIEVDSDINGVFYRTPSGSVRGASSVGSSIITLSYDVKDRVKSFPVYEVGFKIDNRYDRASNVESKEEKRKAIAMARRANAMFEKQLGMIEKNAVIRASAWKEDGAGTKRASIYRKKGFSEVPGFKGDLFMLYNEGSLDKIDNDRAIRTMNWLFGKQDSLLNKSARKRLKCKLTHEQRGAVCQPKSKLRKSKNSILAVSSGIISVSALSVGAALYQKYLKKSDVIPDVDLVLSKPKNKKLNTASKAAIATVAIGGMTAGSYLATRKRYREGFAESATMAEERAKNLKLGKVKPRQKAFLFGVGGGAYVEKSSTIISGENIVVGGKRSFSRHRSDLKGIPIDNSANNFTRPNLEKEDPKRILKLAQDTIDVYWRKHQAGRSETAVNLAANVIAYADKYPDRSLIMMGHSMGGFDVHEAQEILRIARPELEERLISFAFGSEYMGFTNEFGEDHTIGSPHDIFTSKLPTRNLKKFSGVKAHTQSNYFNDPEVVKFVQDRIYKKIEKLEKKQDSADTIDIARLERSFNLVPGLMGEDYISGLTESRNRLDARRKKLRCKPTHEQRGAVCQPKSRFSKKTKTKVVGALVVGIGGATAATIIAKKRKTSNSSNFPQSSPPTTKTVSSFGKGIATGTAVGGVITYAVARKQRQKAVEETIARGKKEVVEVMAAYAKDQAKRETEVAEKEAQLNGQIGKLQADLAAINNRNTQAQQELDVANNRISRLEKAEQAGVQQVAKLSQELDEIVSSKNKTTEELVAAKTALSQAEEMIENVRTQKDNLSGMIQNLETQLSTNQTQKEQELTRLQSQLSELENQRTQLAQGLREQETKLEELDRQSATTLKTRLTDQQKQFEGQLQAKQQELEDEIARGADPKPKKGQSAKRGDLIATESGVAFGASHRWGSNFFNLSPPEQQTKLQNKVNQLLDKSYSDRLLGLQRDFTERVQSTTPKEKQPYPRLSELATTVNVKDKTLIKELKGQEKELLPRLVSLEKDVAQHNLREEVLEYVQQAAGEQLRQSYRELLENFQAFAVDEGGSYSSGAINNDLLKDFDSQSQSIVKNYNSNLDAAISKIISPKFAKQIQQILSEYIEEAPTEEIVMRKRKQVALKLSEKILADIFNLRAR